MTTAPTIQMMLFITYDPTVVAGIGNNGIFAPAPRDNRNPGSTVSKRGHSVPYSNSGSILSPSFVPPGSVTFLSPNFSDS